IFNQIISLPLYSALTDNEVEHIITSLKSLYQLKIGR
ncbi:DegT/DnrJ/EryC1/StrS family aminotransferase, partial [Bacillus thuringiensis]